MISSRSVSIVRINFCALEIVLIRSMLSAILIRCDTARPSRESGYFVDTQHSAVCDAYKCGTEERRFVIGAL